jgi:hypothetical protein
MICSEKRLNQPRTSFLYILLFEDKIEKIPTGLRKVLQEYQLRLPPIPETVSYVPRPNGNRPDRQQQAVLGGKAEELQ